MECPDCGAELSAGGRYCRECGSRTDLSADPDPPTDGGLASRIPLVEPGVTARNVLLGLLAVAFLPFVVAGALAYGVETNRHGLGDRLADSPLGRIPTVENGGWRAAACAFVAALLFFALLGAALTSGDGTASRAALSDRDSDAAASGQIDGATPTGTDVADGGARVAETPGTAGPGGRMPTATRLGYSPCQSCTMSSQ